MNRKFILTALLMLTLLLAACGNDPTPTTAVPTATTAVATATTATEEATATTAAPEATATIATAEATATTAEAAATNTTTTSSTEPTATTSASTTEDTTPKVVAAAEAFLATLTDTEKESVLFDWTDEAQKTRWSNLPEGLYTRDGLMWGNLSEASKTAWLAVMQATLSTEGYNRVIAEWTADDQLATGSSGGGPGGGSLQYGMQYYWVAIIGTPSTTEPWQWQWGGHHVTVNATVSGTEIALTPSFIGCQPCSYTDASGNTVRPLGDIEDEAFALVNSLDATQQSEAILGSTYIDLVLGPGQDGKTIASEGLPASEMTSEQKAVLLKLISHYAGLINDEDAAARIADITANLDQTYFAWYGPITEGSAAYFRITGLSVVIEYSPQSMGGTAANHIHGIYRDPTNEYGSAITK